jgi:hypothetical protein
MLNIRVLLGNSTLPFTVKNVNGSLPNKQQKHAAGSVKYMQSALRSYKHIHKLTT